ncbi:S-layer homology domain-containing protein [Paenibacillus glycanilyticus]|uniref:S-layer homology domain-containing protein n=1 Tax=Paenibacillus glycanilyticus TaxID=126569 RepID=UPI00203FA8EE|nr:S-layer homology domain-containing protein [Paenibacillus glycanilyticus]MCM3629160.1 S-layer homology domain-containing protein [Paenibacillus glycanilyticus]
MLSLTAFIILSGIQPIKLEAADKPLSFTDTKGHWAEAYINWAVQEGVVNGYSDGTFKPDSNVSEAEFLVMLLRAFHAQLPEITNKSSWSDSFYAFASEMNYPLYGHSDFEARNRAILREQVAIVISAADGVNFINSPSLAVSYLYNKGYASGVDPNITTVDNFQPFSQLTRAEAAAFIYKLQLSGFSQLKKCPAEPSSSIVLPETASDLKNMKVGIELALHKKLAETQYGSYVIVRNPDKPKISVAYRSSITTNILVVDYAEVGGEHKITLYDSFTNTLDLAITVLKGAKLTVQDSLASELKNLFAEGGTYNGSNFRAERPENDNGHVIIYFKNMGRTPQ